MNAVELWDLSLVHIFEKGLNKCLVEGATILKMIQNTKIGNAPDPDGTSSREDLFEIIISLVSRERVVSRSCLDPLLSRLIFV